MEKILPALPPVPTSMNPHAVMSQMVAQINSLQQALHQQQNVAIILAAELFRAKGFIQDNMLVAPGHSAVNVLQPLVHAVGQKRIDGLEHFFGGEPATILLSMDSSGVDQLLVVKLVSISEAEAATANALN